MSLPDIRVLPDAYIDRYLYRGLWKLVQFNHGEVCLVPTRRLVALIVMFGKVGYPKDLLALHFQMAGANTYAGNRSPYEIPASMTASFYPISVQRTLPVLLWLLDRNLLFGYEEHPPTDFSDLLAQAQVTPDSFAEWLEEMLAEVPDWLDKWRGNAEAMKGAGWRECAQNGRHYHAYCHRPERISRDVCATGLGVVV